MTKNEIRKVTITLTTEEQKILSSASAIMAQLVAIMGTNTEECLYCELEEGWDMDYSVEELDKVVGALYTIATNPLEIA